MTEEMYAHTLWMLRTSVGQLRHLYQNLVREGKRGLADGILSYEIIRLERLIAKLEARTVI